MEAYVLANNRTPFFDTTGADITLNFAGKKVDHIINVVTITTSDGLANNGVSPQR